MRVNNLPKVATQWNNGVTRDSYRGHRAQIPSALTTRPLSHTCFRSVHEEKMAQFFKNNFSEDRWRKAALKNAFSLLGKQKFERAAAFFLLGGAVKDAIEVLRPFVSTC